MTTVIVPVDFSETSLNAAEYAASFLQGHEGVNLILYHSHHKAEEGTESLAKLEELKKRLNAMHPVNIEVLAHHEPDFIPALDKAARHRNANLVIMGITGRSALGQFLFGSNTLKMVETKACPVLIVPEHASFTKMENVMLTTDFKNTVNSTPSGPIKDFLAIYKPKLHVLNVDSDHYISLTEAYEHEKQELRKLLAEYNPEFYFMRLWDIDEALALFAADRNIDLMIAVRKNHSFIEKMFKTSRTKHLTFHNKLPLLVIHE